MRLTQSTQADFLRWEEDSMAKTILNPDGLPVPRGSYSLVNIAQPGRMVFIAGQTASDHEGKVVGVGDPREQTRYVLGKIQHAVEAVGGTLNDIVAMNVFTTDVRYHRDINETRREVLGASFPTSTMVQVVALARPELLLEINAVAVIP
jgi:enamine deaminase RidA (YjgF/YER057c/UK114 family)